MTTLTPVLALAMLALFSGAVAEQNKNACNTGDSGLEVPDGFCARLVAEGLGPLGHIGVTEHGDVYAAIQDTGEQAGGIAGLRDTSDDGRLDEQVRFGERGGIGLTVRGRWLYFAEPQRILRVPLHPERLGPEDSPTVVAHGLPNTGAPRSLVVGDEVVLASIAAASRACETNGGDEAKGEDPCRERDNAAGIWRFGVQEPGQNPSDHAPYAAGVRDATAMAWNPRDGRLYAVDNTAGDGTAGAPRARGVLRIDSNNDFGWPYCFFDADRGKYLQAPAYGGDGNSNQCCSPFQEPLFELPDDRVATALLFYRGHEFPERYRKAAFVAFGNKEGDNTSSPRVAILPLGDNGQPTGEQETFAEGFSGGEVSDARRILGLAQGAGDELYISDSLKGRIWRVDYVGDAHTGAGE